MLLLWEFAAEEEISIYHYKITRSHTHSVLKWKIISYLWPPETVTCLHFPGILFS